MFQLIGFSQCWCSSFQAWIQHDLWLSSMDRVTIVWHATMPIPFKSFTRMPAHWARWHSPVQWICASTAVCCSHSAGVDFDWVSQTFTEKQWSICSRWFYSCVADRNRCSHFLSVCYLANAIFKHKLFPYVPCRSGCVPNNSPIYRYGAIQLQSTLVKYMHIGQDVPDEWVYRNWEYLQLNVRI